MSVYKCEKHDHIYDRDKGCDKCMAEEIVERVDLATNELATNHDPMRNILTESQFNRFDQLKEMPLNDYRWKFNYQDFLLLIGIINMQQEIINGK